MSNNRVASSGRSRVRERLSRLLREGGDVLTVQDAARILGTSREDASKIVARWCRQGWLRRVKRGVYVPVPIESSGPDRALEDAWIVIPDLFGPAYVGGWSAAEHWGLTEQIFRDVCVFSARQVPKRYQTIGHTRFVVTHIAPHHQFGTKTVWRRQKKVSVSDPTRTIVDMLSRPWTGGGVSHLVDCFRQYAASSYFDAPRLVSYAERLGNATVFKRLGFLADQLLPENQFLVSECKMRLSKGNSQLDPSLKGNKLITRWRLFVPSGLSLATERAS